jgi:DNA-binding transcriptional ArsR family regulator
MESLLNELEYLFNALSDKTRLEIVFSLLNGEKSVQEISQELGKSQSSISHHLACLKNCGIVNTRKDGKFTYYSISRKEVIDIINIATKHVRDYSQSILSCEIVKEEKKS